MSMKMNPDVIIDRLHDLEEDRYNWETMWDDVVDYMLPNRSPFRGTITPGEDRSVTIYDSSAYKNNIVLAANLNDMLTNQSSMWFMLGVDDPDLDESPVVQDWLQDMTNEVRKHLDNSNFYDQIHELYLDLGSLGTGVLYIEDSDDEDEYVNFKACHLREIYISEDKYGRVDTVFRKFQHTVRQCIQRWGDDEDATLSDLVLGKEEDDPNRLVDLIHVVFPREERDPELKDNKNMKYASVWMETESKQIIKEGGYKAMPYLVPRWMKSSGEVYGRSPALSVLADIKTLNAMMETVLIAGQMIAEPPLQVPDDGFLKLNIGPRGISYYRAGTNDFIRPLEIGSRLPITFDMIQEKRDSIADSFFVTQLNVIDKTEMTAEEVRARQLANMRVIGPTVGRLQNELLSDLIFRVLDILHDSVDENGKQILPEPPAVVQGLSYKLKYVSPLAKAKRQNELQAIQGAIQIAGNIAQTTGRVEVVDNLNVDIAYRKSVDILGAPNDILTPIEGVLQIRQARAKAAQEAAQLEATERQAGAAEAGSKAVKNFNQAEGE